MLSLKGRLIEVEFLEVNFTKLIRPSCIILCRSVRKESKFKTRGNRRYKRELIEMGKEWRFESSSLQWKRLDEQSR